MDDRRRRAWEALELGPLWRLRSPAAPDAAGAGPGVGATAAAQAAEPVPVPGRADADGAPGPVVLDGVPVAADGDAPQDGAAGRPVDGPVPAGFDPASAEGRAARIARLPWPALAETVAGCTACALCGSRRSTVFGVGPVPAPWMLVGEAPGEQEDLRGEPFVGPAGRLLDAMLAAIGVRREHDAFIANVLKCRPPRNRDPLPEEVARCEPFLIRQVELLQPRLIVVLGRFAAQSLLRTDASIASLRGRVHRYRAGGRELPLVVTYHPAYLLRSLPDKSRAWADLRLARRTFDALEPGQ